jgi:hypothetical protein
MFLSRKLLALGFEGYVIESDCELESICSEDSSREFFVGDDVSESDSLNPDDLDIVGVTDNFTIKLEDDKCPITLEGIHTLMEEGSLLVVAHPGDIWVSMSRTGLMDWLVHQGIEHIADSEEFTGLTCPHCRGHLSINDLFEISPIMAKEEAELREIISIVIGFIACIGGGAYANEEYPAESSIYLNGQPVPDNTLIMLGFALSAGIMGAALAYAFSYVVSNLSEVVHPMGVTLRNDIFDDILTNAEDATELYGLLATLPQISGEAGSYFLTSVPTTSEISMVLKDGDARFGHLVNQIARKLNEFSILAANYRIVSRDTLNMISVVN